jgi:hypothetical protein
MKRRNFLMTGLAGIAGIAGVAGVCYARSTDSAGIAKVLHKKLSYLKLDPDGVQRFAHDVVSTRSSSNARMRMLLRIFDAAGPLYTRPALNGDNALENDIRHGEDSILTVYLLSSDFFKNGSDMNRTVHYLRYYDPMIACGNPFARPVVVPTPA